MFNTEEIYTQVGNKLLARRGCRFDDDLKDAVMGLTPQATFETMIRWHHLDETWQEMARESNRIFIGLLDAQLAPLPGLLELLDALEAAGIPKAIASSSSRQALDAVVSRFEMHERFQFILAAEDIVRGKPDPEIYLAAAERFGVQPAEILVLEDSQNGCRAGASAGAFVVAVPGPHSREHDFSMARLIVDSLADPRLYEALGL